MSAAWRWTRHTTTQGQPSEYVHGPYVIQWFPRRRVWKVYIDGELTESFKRLREAKWWAQWRTS